MGGTILRHRIIRNKMNFVIIEEFIFECINVEVHSERRSFSWLGWVVRRDTHWYYFAVPGHGKIFKVELHSESGKSISTYDDIISARGIHHSDRNIRECSLLEEFGKAHGFCCHLLITAEGSSKCISRELVDGFGVASFG